MKLTINMEQEISELYRQLLPPETAVAVAQGASLGPPHLVIALSKAIS